MTGNIAQAIETIRRCLALRESGKSEAVLRSEIQSALRVIFTASEDKNWIDHYVEGAEALTKIAKAGGAEASRFIDNLVGSTTIEYESDLRNLFKRDEGYGQVREHAAGLIKAGVPPSQVRGILSDTVEWFAYDVQLTPGVDPAFCTPADVTLVPVDELKIAVADEPAAGHLVRFVRKHLAREQSRPLRAEFLAADLGLDSGAYMRSSGPLHNLVDEGRAADPSIALATSLWSQFIDHLEGDAGAFRASAYVDEAYVAILARLLGANVLEGHAILSADDELKSILTGAFFRDRYELDNMVEEDYFGWLVRPGYIERLVPIAREIQRDLYAYDFSKSYEEDLFGRLMAQLARKSQRKLLGQEWTPAWLARHLARRCLDNLPAGDAPRIVDMCCGSGSILAEVLKTAREKFKFTALAELHDVATGFDIDPLAVALSKTTWVVTLAAEIKSAKGKIIIPIYHADSLFAVTPVSAIVPLIGESDTIDVALDGAVVKLPHALVRPEYSSLFDRIIDWAYDEALDARKKGEVPALSRHDAETFVTGAAAATNTALPEDLKKLVVDAVHALAARMSALAVANRNGIWAFILRNAYRPGLLAGQFNGLVSNPPWLAMSGLADNPYRGVLTARARLYGIRPAGQSFLHLELGTTHLLHAVDRYLKADASIACLVPGSVFNGHHHERLRQRGFLSSKRPVALEITEVWQVAPGTFKYPSAAIIGRKRAAAAGLAATPVTGFLAAPDAVEQVDFSVREIGTRRTAWVLEKAGTPVAASGDTAVPPQGADLMPRTAVCVEVVAEAGAEWRVDTPQHGSPWRFTVKAAKELKTSRFAGRAAPAFIHRMAQSENLLPFVLGQHRAPIAIPAVREEDGSWRILDEKEIRGMGLTETARRFQAINRSLEAVGQGKTLQQRIDERGKLMKQVIGEKSGLVLSGAGGKHICAAYVPAEEARSLAIDQTLYWQVFGDENEAWYVTGMLNSHAMTEAISPFNPKGDFGERHIHTLPYRMMPPYDLSNDDHRRIAALARNIAKTAQAIIEGDAYLNDPSRALPARRRKLRERLRDLPQFQQMEESCAVSLGTTAFGDETEGDGEDYGDG
jgi:hypothetical protein